MLTHLKHFSFSAFVKKRKAKQIFEIDYIKRTKPMHMYIYRHRYILHSLTHPPSLSLCLTFAFTTQKDGY